jgi:hypothetical protein
LPNALAKVPSSSDLPTFAIVAAQIGGAEFTTYVLANHLTASWMEASALAGMRPVRRTA